MDHRCKATLRVKEPIVRQVRSYQKILLFYYLHTLFKRT
jgi:hypothetical protein